MKDIKFKLTSKSKVNAWGVTLFQIEATCDITERGVKKGDKGGWVESEKTSNGNARVSGNAWVSGDAEVSGNARVYGNAEVSGNARVYGNAEVYGDALDSGYCFAYKGNNWNVTEVPTKDGSGVLLIKDYVEPKETKESDTINIGGTEYEVTDELKDALKGLKEV